MYLYALTLQKATAITHCIYGNFSAKGAQEILVARGKILELYRPDENYKLQSVLSVEVFGVIRSMLPFRLPGGTTDYIVLGSDSGRIVILQYNATKNRFERIHQETFGRTGCRRLVPGQFLAADPRGRAIMIAAIEKHKFVYVMNRDSLAKLTISSPLEAHKSHTITSYIVGVDVGFDNPVFAAIEADYQDIDSDPTGEAFRTYQKQVVFYELDLGLNHVVRKWSEPVDRSAYMLVSLPGGADGPGGVLVLCEDWIIYKNQGHSELRAAIPRRQGNDQSRVLLTAAVVVRQKAKFFVLAQAETGDLYKVTMAYQTNRVSALAVKYFDTVPVAMAMAAMKAGVVFVAAEFGPQYVYAC